MFITYFDLSLEVILISDIWWFREYEIEKCGQPAVVDRLQALYYAIISIECSPSDNGKEFNHLHDDEAGHIGIRYSGSDKWKKFETEEELRMWQREYLLSFIDGGDENTGHQKGN